MLFIQAIQNAMKPALQRADLDPQIVKRTLCLEEVIHEQSFNAKHVTDLLELYTYLVQHFSQQSQSMQLYFEEKMQLLVSRPEISRIIQEHEEEQDKVNRLTSMRTTYDINQLKLEEENRFNRPFLHTPEKAQKMRFSVFKKHKAKEREISQEVAGHQHDQEADLKNLLEQYESISKEFDKAIKQQLEDQNDQLKERMQRRKGKKKHTRTSNSQESKRTTLQTQGGQYSGQIQRWKLLSQVEETVHFMRKSVNRLKN